MAAEVGFELELRRRKFIWGAGRGPSLALPESEARRLHGVMAATTWGEPAQGIDAAGYDELVRCRFDDGEGPQPEDPFDPPTGECNDFDDPRALMLDSLFGCSGPG